MSATAIGVVGAGARTALGRSLPASAAAVRAGIGRAVPHPYLVDRRRGSLVAAMAEWLPQRFAGAARFVALAKNAAKEALAGLERAGDAAASIDVLVGLPHARPGRPDDLDDAIARALRGPRVARVTTFAEGHAAALNAIEQACAKIRRGEAEVCLAGGVDSYLEPETMDFLEDTARLKNPDRPWGFVPGEAAAFCVLASPRWLEAHGVVAPLSVLGAASAHEPAPLHGDAVCTGSGLTAAFDGALAPLADRRARVTRLVGDLNGEPYRVDELGFALARIGDALARPGAVLAPAACWGDVGAASGALFAGLAFQAALRAETAATTLAWASSENGRRAAALFVEHGARC
ncbi:MAG TPA: beta-ketoacyl synthase N-terminal-like domain-containing protein [Minicystis sp.]|nr:beta-ketoacyl synthase N-terminal-like domain-containing protein [Minicystis sp.]